MGEKQQHFGSGWWKFRWKNMDKFTIYFGSRKDRDLITISKPAVEAKREAKSNSQILIILDNGDAIH